MKFKLKGTVKFSKNVEEVEKDIPENLRKKVNIPKVLTWP